MSNYTTNKPTYFGLPIETVINVEEDGQKIEVIAIPYDNFLTMEDELNQLNAEKEAMQESMRDMMDSGEDLSMFTDHIWFPNDLWEPDNKTVAEDVWDWFDVDLDD